MSEKMQTITVRLPAEVVKEVAALASKRRIDKSALLRNIVTEALTHGEQGEILVKLSDLEQLILNLQHKLAKATAGILRDLQTIPKDRKLKKEDIENWIRDNIL